MTQMNWAMRQTSTDNKSVLAKEGRMGSLELADANHYTSVQFGSVSQSCLTLCDPMSRSMPGLPVHHQLPEFTQIHVHQVGDAIHPSHPLSPSPSAFNLSQHEGLFHWVSSSHQVVKVLALRLQHQSFQRIFRKWFPLGLAGLISLQSKGLSRVFSSTTVQKY